jgi:hypothetical protein
LLLAINQDHLVAVGIQVVGSGRADDPAADHNYSQGFMPLFRLVAAATCVPFAEIAPGVVDMPTDFFVPTLIGLSLGCN